MLTRLYQATPLNIHMLLPLDEKANHHVLHVLRAKIGDRLMLFNGQGGDYTAVITAIHKKTVTVEILSFTDREAEPPIDIHLAQSIARGEKMDFVIQKAVELGVKKIIPLITEYGNVRLDSDRQEKRWQHWQAVAISACEQCGRNRIPEIVIPLTLKEWLPSVSNSLAFVLSPHAVTKFPSTAELTANSITLLIGPEGGLSEAEIAAALAHHFLALNLGPRVLRTETAAMAAIAVLQYCYGDFK